MTNHPNRTDQTHVDGYITLTNGWSYGDMTNREINRLNEKMERAARLAGVRVLYTDEADKFHDDSVENNSIDWWNQCPCWYDGTAAQIAAWLRKHA